MPHVDIDSILSKLTDWNLTLSIGGKKFAVSPPSLATLGLIQRIKESSANIQDVKDTVVEALTPLVDPASGADPKTWNLHQLLAAATAIFQHAKETTGKNLAGVGEAVRAAMTPPSGQAKTPVAIAAPTTAPLASATAAAIASPAKS